MQWIDIYNRTEFQSSSGKTPEFIGFAAAFKRQMKNFLSKLDAGEISFNVGHFYISGFFKFKEQWWYFSLGDVRYKLMSGFLIRKADSNKDYTGKTNQYVNFDNKEKFADRITKIITEQSGNNSINNDKYPKLDYINKEE